MILAALCQRRRWRSRCPARYKVSFADIFGWWLPLAGSQPRPAVIALHGCDGLYLRNQLNARERSVAELLGRRGFHVLLSDNCRGADIHGALDWLAARPEVDRNRIVVLGWSHGGSALLATLKHRIGPMPLQARAAIAFAPSCGPYAVTPGSYLPVAPLLILVAALDERSAAAVPRSSRNGRRKSWCAPCPPAATISRPCSNSSSANCAEDTRRVVRSRQSARHKIVCYARARSQNNTGAANANTRIAVEARPDRRARAPHPGRPPQHLTKERQR